MNRQAEFDDIAYNFIAERFLDEDDDCLYAVAHVKEGCEIGYQYAVKRSDNVIKLIVEMAKTDIAFTDEEAVKFYHEEMNE